MRVAVEGSPGCPCKQLPILTHSHHKLPDSSLLDPKDLPGLKRVRRFDQSKTSDRI
jgi:hypothetical protein